jgi:hypothetical protein
VIDAQNFAQREYRSHQMALNLKRKRAGNVEPRKVPRLLHSCVYILTFCRRVG